MDPTERSNVTSIGIYHTSDGRLCCAICPSSLLMRNWKKHAKSEEHVFFLSHFEVNYKNSVDHVVCVICEDIVEWQDVKKHAITHEIMPWYEPPDKLRFFYKNQAMELNKLTCYCHLCDEIFTDWVALYAHFDQENHLKQRQRTPAGVLPRGFRNVLKKWISQGFVPGKGETIDCKVCNVIFPRSKHAEHTLTTIHRDAKFAFVQKLLDRCSKEKQSTGKSEKTSENIPAVGTTECPKAQKISAAPRAMICNFSVDLKVPGRQEPLEIVEEFLDDQVSPHVPQPEPANRPKDDENVNGIFIGSPLDFAISRSSNLQFEKQPKIKRNDNKPYCLLCNIEIPNHAAAMNHLREKRHLDEKTKCGVHYIVPIENTDYYCQLCDQCLKDIDLYYHVTSNEHSVALKEFENLHSMSKVNSANVDSVKKAESPFSGESSRQNAAPSSQNVMLFSPDPMQCWANATPSCLNVTASHQTAASSWQNATPSFKNVTPSSQNFLPSFQHLSLTGPNLTPSRQTDVHSHQDVTPSRQSEEQPSQSVKTAWQIPAPITQDLTPHWQFPIPPWEARTPSCQPPTPVRKAATPSCKPSSFRKATKSLSETTTTTTTLESETPFSVATPVPEDSSCIFIVKQNAKKLICRVCEDGQYLVSKKNLAAHVESQKHRISLKRYGCENIETRENGDYHCSCCDLDIPDLKSVHLHVKEKKHTSSLIKKKDETRGSQKIVGGSDSPEKVNQHPPVRNLLSDYIVKEIRTNPTMKIASEFIDEQFLIEDYYRRHPSFTSRKLTPDDCNTIGMESEDSKQTELSIISVSMAADLSIMLKQFEDNKKMRCNEKKSQGEAFRKRVHDCEKTITIIRCPICSEKATDLTELHSHMAQHFGDEFSRKKIAGCEPINGDAILNGSANLGKFFEYIEPGRQKDPFADLDNENCTTPLMDSQIIPEPIEKPNSPRKHNLKAIIQHLNFKDDFIYDMSDKVNEIKLAFDLCLILDSESIYCLVCRRTVENKMQNYIEHMSSADHCDYLELMEKDHESFSRFPQQFSDLDLAHEHMQELNDDSVRCFLCGIDVGNLDDDIIDHINDPSHLERRESMRTNAMANFDKIKSQIKCDWYSVENYWCVVCRAKTESEVSFVRHLQGRKHDKNLRHPDNRNKTMIFDFCPSCALLWYGYRCSYSYHSDISTHKWLTRDCYYERCELPILAKSLLTTLDQWVDERIRFLDEIQDSEKNKESSVIRDLEKSARMKFPNAKAHIFGSRISGLSSQESDVDIFLDCQNMYDGKESTYAKIRYFMEGVRDCLLNDPTVWGVEEVLTKCRSPIIRAFHRETELACDISFENGLSVENSKLIRKFNKIFPSCQKMILILKQWLGYCDLSGNGRISSYALCWWVIFYFQQEGILPTIANLISVKNKSHVIAGWETGVGNDFPLQPGPGEMTLRELLIRFFTFYADFDFRYDVACPLVGEPVKKRSFIEYWNLPPEMKTYISYRKSNIFAEPFRIDSPMCIQDPFDLQHNLTKAVGKVYLNRFRIYCIKSLDLLYSHRQTVI